MGGAKGIRNQWQTATLLALLSMLTSWLVSEVGIALGEAYVSAGSGFPRLGEHVPNLYRFDSAYYASIAETGYRYNGDPMSSPNIVFAPAFPLLVRSLSAFTNCSIVDAGFVVNRVLLVGAALFWLLYLTEAFDAKTAFVAVLAAFTSVAAYSLNGYYSEPIFVFLWSLCLWAHSHEKWWLLALSCAGLGATRLTAFPIAAVFAAAFVYRAYHDRRLRAKTLKNLSCALLCMAGTASYLGFIDREFGNPISLLPTIQKASWGRFHRDTSWFDLLSGGYVLRYIGDAFNRGWLTLLDSRTINLIWLLVGLAAVVYLVVRHRQKLVAWTFLAYVLMIYWSNAGSEYLISCHRFIAIVPVVFVMFGALYRWVSERTTKLAANLMVGVLALVNLGYGVYMTAMFNQGQWSYF